MELLSPAGSFEAARAAFIAGADAVYVGGGFSARAYAKNFNDDELLDIIRLAHLIGKRVYVAVNIMIFEDELEAALCHIKKLYEFGVDAVIISDMGLLWEAKKRFTEMPFHISTQAGIHDSFGARAVKRLGAERVVPARETDLQGISDIAATGLEVEVFCHGALCSGYSGACLMSSFIGARSGNRGKCAQPCRLFYTDDEGNKGYLLSTADLITINALKDIEKSGACSLKIEGRMKSAEYVYSVTEEYRRALSGKKTNGAAERLKESFNRGGFTEGYLFGNKDVTYTARPDHIGRKLGKVVKLMGSKAVITSDCALNKLDSLTFAGKNTSSLIIGFADKCREGYIVPIPKGVGVNDEVYRTADALALDGIRRALEGELVAPAAASLFISDKNAGCLIMNAGEDTACVGIEACETAKNPVNTQKLCEQISKTGGTGIKIVKAEVRTEGAPFISAAALNSVRRQCVNELKEKIIEAARRYQPIMGEESAPFKKAIPDKTGVSVSVANARQARAAFAAGAARVYVYANKFTDHEEFNFERSGRLYIALTPFTTKLDIESIKRVSHIYDGAIVGGIGEIFAAKELFDDVRADFSMNIGNSFTIKALSEMGVSGCTASAECSLKQLELLKMPYEAFVYGHIPMIMTRHCPLKKLGRCASCGVASLKDRRGYSARFYNMGTQECMPALLNPVVTAVKDVEAIVAAGCEALRLMFFYEDEQKVFEVTKMYMDAINGGSITVEEEANSAHLYRGV